ncbi:ABC transporter ATP-binding protein, partial [Rhizobium sp. Pop5]
HRGLLMPWGEQDDAAVEEALSRVDMRERAGQLWQTLSGGERQRVHIARSLAQSPSELLLDEPTNHLDIQHQLDILSLIARLGITSVVALHDLNLAAMFCDKLVVLRKGEVVASGTPEDVLTEELIGRVFGVRAHVQKSAVHGRHHIQYLMD